MRIATDKLLSAELRKMAHDVHYRLWISSPYVGGWSATRCLIDIVWRENAKVDVRLLTDIKNECWLDPDTIEQFQERGTVKHLRGLHAKLFIVDDQALLTSANLTRRAFTQRCEVGAFLNKAEAAPVIKIFENWWDKEAKIPSPGWVAKLRKVQPSHNKREEPSGESMKTRCLLPSAPDDGPRGGIGDYDVFRKRYDELAETYRGIQRLWRTEPLYLETDAFLNFLFHSAQGTPSKQFTKKSPRKLSASRKLAEIKRHATEFAKVVRESKDHGGKMDRVQRWRTVRNLLRESRIKRLTLPEVKQVLDCFHCLQKRSFYKEKFVDSSNNNLGTIRSAWARVLHGDPNLLEAEMHRCVHSLKAFGRSSVQELLGWYDPKTYPIRNSNSNAGLRYFGYNVAAQ
jgi:hypothetical protein